MKQFYSYIFYIAIVLFFLQPLTTLAQEENQTETDENTESEFVQKGFHLGFVIGGYWANRGTAYLYDGYGFDYNTGQRSSFANSMLRYQIVDVYGGANGGVDYIAQLLNVNPGDWTFTESDMPINLRYTTTFLVGLNMRYRIDKKSSILININGTKLVANGRFTITALNTSGIGSGNGFPNQQKINQFTITGTEQRLMFQFGYQRLFGKHPKLKILTEVGMNIVMSKAQKNQAYLTSSVNGGANNITIDLMNTYRQSPYNYFSAKYFIGVGIGVVGGLGFNYDINSKYSIQLLYIPSYDRISLGPAPVFKMQNGCGLRIYYNISN